MGENEGEEREESSQDTAAPGEASPAPASGVDFSSIRFGGSSSGERSRSGTSHSSSEGSRETFRGSLDGARQVEVAQGEAPRAEPFERADSAGDDIGGEADAILAKIRGARDGAPASGGKRRVSAPRAGASERNWELEDESVDGQAVAEEPSEPQIRLDPGGPPVGPWVEVTDEEWATLTTADKARIDALALEMQKMEAAENWFQWFELSHDSPPGALKKSYFKMARRYHPDALGDEPEVYSRVATSLFAKVSEAYEVLSDEAGREKYVNKHILGIKDEDELAMEKVQQILAAEAAFKAGLTVLNNGKVTEALQHFKKAVDGYPEEAEYAAYYGYTLFRANQGSDAERAAEGLDIIEKAIKLKEMAPKPYHLLGKAHLLAGDPVAARKWLRKSLKLLPDNPEAVRDYRRAESMAKGRPAKSGGDDEGKGKGKGGLAGFFGRFRKDKKKAAPSPNKDVTSLDDFDFSQFED
jgi:curved DNA-binding protein CbpA